MIATTAQTRTNACCQLCGGMAVTSLVDAEGWRGQWPHPYDLVCCQGCGMIFVHPQPDEAALAAAYPEHYYAYEQHAQESNPAAATRLARASRRVRARVAAAASRPQRWQRVLNPWYVLFRGRFAGIPRIRDRGRPGRLLDVGCGDGAYLDVFRELGWEVSGVEMDRGAVARARAAGFAVAQGPFESTCVTGPFDVIRFWHVLEHVRHPTAVLARARALLAPGGDLIIGVPNAASAARRLCGVRWTAWDLPRHLNHYTPLTLQRQLTHTGFRVTSLRYCSVGTLVPSVNEPLSRSVPARALGIGLDAVLDLLRLGDSLEARAVIAADAHGTR